MKHSKIILKYTQIKKKIHERNGIKIKILNPRFSLEAAIPVFIPGTNQ